MWTQRQKFPEKAVEVGREKWGAKEIFTGYAD
jgi:hypothetical protein